MNEKTSKTCLITFNVIVMMAGVIMFVGGLLLEYTNITRSILNTLHTNTTSSQVGAVGVALIAIGALLIFISFLGCCGAVYESRGLLFIYFLIVLLLFLGQFAVVIVSFVFGAGTFSEVVNNQLERFVNGYKSRNTQTEDAVLDTVQQYFDCCGYNGPRDYRNYNPGTTPATTTTMAPTLSNITGGNMSLSKIITTSPEAAETTVPMIASNSTMAASEDSFAGFFWPQSCCKNEVERTDCMNNTLSASELGNYLNMEGCTMSIEEWVKEYLYFIGGVALAIALIELVAMIMACSLRNALD